MLASTAKATGPIRQGGEPQDPQGPIPAELVPTPSENTAQALVHWLSENPSANTGGVRVLDDHKTVVIYWKGDPPTKLQDFARTLPVPVTFKMATYSRDELVTVAHVLIADPDVTSAGPSRDYSGVTITLSSKTAAPQTVLATARARTSVPVVLRGTEDIKPLVGDASTANGCPVPARCGDQAPWYGGGLMHLYGTSSACSIGASVYAGPYTTSPPHGTAAGGPGKGTTVATPSASAPTGKRISHTT